MSAETAKQIELVASAGAGITIRISDANLQEIARGVDAIRVGVAPSLYVIEWDSTGQRGQTLIRIKPGDPSPRVVDLGAMMKQARHSGRPEDSPLSPSFALTEQLPREELLQLVGQELRPSERAHESSVAVIVAGEEGLPPIDVLPDVGLFDRKDTALRANKREAPFLALDNGEFARCYRVRPGRYNVRFRSLTGDTLAQSVPALAGRQTIVFLQAGRKSLTVADGGMFVQQEGVGIDPTRTIAITVDGNEASDRIRERIRLAGVLLYDLASGTGSLSRNFLDILGQDETDPLLKLYAALVARSCIDHGRSPALDESWPTTLSNQQEASARWEQLIESWVAEPGERGTPIDATALWWRMQRIQRTEPSSAGGSEAHVPSRIEVPPMLEASWRWVISESIANPAAVPSTPSLLAATRSAGGTTPWLCWRASAAKAAKTAGERGAPRSLNELIDVVRQSGLQLFERRGPNGGDPFSTLSPDVAMTVARVSQLAQVPQLDASRPDSPRERRDPVESLALSLLLPAGLLRRRLLRTIEELQTALSSPASPETRQQSPMARSTAPGLTRKINYPDDLQRGRFGKHRSRDGFTTTAEFQETSSPGWTRIVIRVFGKVPDHTEVEFHLHDSFKPVPMKYRQFKNGVAELVVTVWGGFTVGVWVPSFKVELELNLAKQKGAPHHIRTR